MRVERFDHPLAGKGGLCRIEGVLVVLVDAKLGALEPLSVIGEALAGLELDGIAVPAVLSTFTSFPFGTISTNFAAQPASMMLQERQ